MNCHQLNNLANNGAIRSFIFSRSLVRILRVSRLRVEHTHFCFYWNYFRIFLRVHFSDFDPLSLNVCVYFYGLGNEVWFQEIECFTIEFSCVSIHVMRLLRILVVL